MVAQRADELIYKGPDGEALASADERDLTIAFKSGSEDAYSVIYGRYRPRVESLCRRMLTNPHDAQEATQEAFLRVFQALHSFNGRYQLGAWITRIATNVCLDTLRSQARRPSQPTPIEEMEFSLPDTGIDSDPEFFVIRRAESRRVRRVLESLPPMHRAAIILRDFEGLTYGEIAIALGITDQQTKALIHRARGGFKRAWSPASVASIFLPARFVNRFRKVESSVSEQANQVARTATPLADAAASASQAASSCGAFIQSCGAVVTERFATAAAAVVITAGAVSAGASTPVTPVSPPTVLAAVDTGPKAPQTKQPTKTPHRNRDEAATEVPVVVPVPEPTPDPTPPVPDPTPSPTPSDPPPGDGDTPPPAPDPLPIKDPYFGFSNSTTKSGDTPVSSSATVDCAAGTVSQQIQSVIHWEGETYPMTMTLAVHGNVDLDLTLTRDGSDYSYDGGAASATLKRTGQKLQIGFSGSYSYIGSGRPETVGMPDYGQFVGNLTLDCSVSSVAGQDVTLYVQ